MTFRRAISFDKYFKLYVYHARETWYKTMSENCSNATEMLMNNMVEMDRTKNIYIFIYVKEQGPRTMAKYPDILDR